MSASSGLARVLRPILYSLRRHPSSSSGLDVSVGHLPKFILRTTRQEDKCEPSPNVSIDDDAHGPAIVA